MSSFYIFLYIFALHFFHYFIHDLLHFIPYRSEKASCRTEVTFQVTDIVSHDGIRRERIPALSVITHERRGSRTLKPLNCLSVNHYLFSLFFFLRSQDLLTQSCYLVQMRLRENLRNQERKRKRKSLFKLNSSI